VSRPAIIALRILAWVVIPVAFWGSVLRCALG